MIIPRSLLASDPENLKRDGVTGIQRGSHLWTPGWDMLFLPSYMVSPFAPKISHLGLEKFLPLLISPSSFIWLSVLDFALNFMSRTSWPLRLIFILEVSVFEPKSILPHTGWTDSALSGMSWISAHSFPRLQWVPRAWPGRPSSTCWVFVVKSFWERTNAKNCCHSKDYYQSILLIFVT